MSSEAGVQQDNPTLGTPGVLTGFKASMPVNSRASNCGSRANLKKLNDSQTGRIGLYYI